MPTRTCVGCRRSADKAELVRIVLADGDGYAIDARQVAPGRGAYVHPGCGGRALKTRAVPRALRAGGCDGVQLAALLGQLDAEASAWANQAVAPYNGGCASR